VPTSKSSAYTIEVLSEAIVTLMAAKHLTWGPMISVGRRRELPLQLLGKYLGGSVLLV